VGDESDSDPDWAKAIGNDKGSNELEDPELIDQESNREEKELDFVKMIRLPEQVKNGALVLAFNKGETNEQELHRRTKFVQTAEEMVWLGCRHRRTHKEGYGTVTHHIG